ncbi:hypothetical protein N7481_011105 [Penicillium waksmanii]|uniref:uncharacterized protein n=1 Tax=Penicillium waksmanii TaxID=69791 RepID=UPI0025468B50|nr:uncharacterized protein N7481_011105 [Penicillium waksmanii]KAJ5973895.1 hypothetical protein N7481_011105 [Penicillium waksmanii]
MHVDAGDRGTPMGMAMPWRLGRERDTRDAGIASQSRYPPDHPFFLRVPMVRRMQEAAAPYY